MQKMKENKVLKIIFFLTCMSLFVYQIILFLLEYQDYPTTRSGNFKENL